VLLYDPRKLTAPWDQTTCSGNATIEDLHWQHTITCKSSRTAVKGSSKDSQNVGSSAKHGAVLSTAAAAPDHAAAILATPAPAPHVGLASTWVIVNSYMLSLLVTAPCCMSISSLWYVADCGFHLHKADCCTNTHMSAAAFEHKLQA